jgi:adenylate cyclase
MASIWGELKRRNVVKVAVAYGIVAWLLLQVIVSVEAPLSLPDWTDTLVIVILAIGFVLALFLAWAYELTPLGVKRTKTVPLSESVSKVTGRRLDFLIIGCLALALGFVLVDDYVLPETSESNLQTGDVLPSSVAVLPFENLSPNADDAFFAAGLHEEVLNQLVKLHGLSVISRTSVLRYADSGLSIPEIARELNVGTIMEGSVRYASDRVRVTVQLIDAATDEHLWSETYDREFADIFAIETDIALNVVDALEAEFSLEEQQVLERPPTTSPAAYRLYLRALAVAGSGDRIIGPDARSKIELYLDQALAIDPQLALAYVKKSSIAPVTDPESARLNAERALQIDPNLGLAHFAVASAHTRGWRVAEAREEFERALELSPNDPEIISGFSRYLAYVEEYDEATRLARYAAALDPNNSASYASLGGVLQLSGDINSAADALLQSTILDPLNFSPIMNLARLEAGRGNLAEAVTYLQTAEERFGDSGIGFIAHGYALAGQRDIAIELATRARARGPGGAGFEALLSLILGEREKALEFLEQYVDHRRPLGLGMMRIKYNVWPDPALSDPEFVAVLERISIAD